MVIGKKSRLNKVVVKDIKSLSNSISVKFSSEGLISKYFIENIFFVEWEKNINPIPKSIAVIPFISNILPIIWITDSNLYIEEIDKAFYEQIKKIKSGYKKMYPNLSFKGKIFANKILNNNFYGTNSLLFFSGGVDATSSLIDNFEKKPFLLTVWGSDIDITDKESWNNVYTSNVKISSDYNLNIYYVKSNFRKFINELLLNKLVLNSKDAWWHGFQHGIGLISLCVVFYEFLSLKEIIFAASFTNQEKGKLTCASDPTIDNHFKFSNVYTNHDGYFRNRQNKIHNIVDKFPNGTFLRVCYSSQNGFNCSKCEKCTRTMMAIISEGFNPNNYGFKLESYKNFLNIILKHNVYDKVNLPLWLQIQNKFKLNIKNMPFELKYFVKFKFNLNFMSVLRKIRMKFLNRITLIINVIKKNG